MDDYPASTPTRRRSRRISATGPLHGPDAYETALQLDQHARDEAWMMVSQVISRIADAEELIAIKDALRRVGRAFESLFPDGEPDVYAALARLLARSSETQRSCFSHSLSRYELETLGTFV